MIKKNRVAIIILSIAFTLAALIVLPFDEGILGNKGVQLGLDLVGGSHLVYQAQFPEGATAEEKARNIDRALDTIRRRIDKYGVTEPIIQKQEGGRILVQLPGFTDIEEAKKLVEETGFLEFRKVELDKDGNLIYLSNYLEDTRSEFFNGEEEGPRIFVDNAGNPLVSQLTGDFLDEASPYYVSGAAGAEAGISIKWDKKGEAIFDQIASDLYAGSTYQSPKQELGIFLDNILISHPWIKEPAYGGEATITSPGGFSVAEVELLANLLESGALPMPLEKPPLYEEKVSATLGADFIKMSLMAGLIGIALVMLFMGLYYRLPGGLASLALIFYGTVVLALFKLMPVTLTLAGIGGFVLSIGMAVDANILIFERMKEELKLGRTLGAAIEVGFRRAWPAIRDSNVTTFIICGILYIFGSRIVESAPVMGFAVTLAIGVAISMFTAIVVTRTLLRILAGTRLARKASLFRIQAGEDNA